jgi:hypothetical protein
MQVIHIHSHPFTSIHILTDSDFELLSCTRHSAIRGSTPISRHFLCRLAVFCLVLFIFWVVSLSYYCFGRLDGTYVAKLTLNGGESQIQVSHSSLANTSLLEHYKHFCNFILPLPTLARLMSRKFWLESSSGAESRRFHLRIAFPHGSHSA